MGDRYRVHSAPDDINMDPNARPCARGEHCASRSPDGQPALGPRVLCEADRDILHRAVEQLPDLYLGLYLALGDKSRADGPHVTGGGKTPPVPIRLDVEALMARTIEILESWDERVRHIAHLSGPDTATSRARRGGVAVTTMCRTLAAHLDALLALGSEPMTRTVPEHAVTELPDDNWATITQHLDGADAALEILRLHGAARGKLGYTPQHVRLLSRCWDCDASGRLVRRDGMAGLDEHATCEACGSQYVGPRLARLMAEEDRSTRERNERKAAS